MLKKITVTLLVIATIVMITGYSDITTQANNSIPYTTNDTTTEAISNTTTQTIPTDTNVINELPKVTVDMDLSYSTNADTGIIDIIGRTNAMDRTIFAISISDSDFNKVKEDVLEVVNGEIRTSIILKDKTKTQTLLVTTRLDIGMNIDPAVIEKYGVKGSNLDGINVIMVDNQKVLQSKLQISYVAKEIPKAISKPVVPATKPIVQVKKPAVSVTDFTTKITQKFNNFAGSSKMFTKDQVEKFFEANKVKSKTEYALFANLQRYQMAVMKKDASGKWKMVDTYIVGIGASHSPTVTGVYEIYKRTTVWDYPNFTVYYPMNFHNGYAFHSVLMSKSGNSVYDGTVGAKVSHGCLRQPITKAKWLYNTIPTGTRVVVVP